MLSDSQHESTGIADATADATRNPLQSELRT
jgi:hypothetical protein